jgi:hypothetical protein
MLKAGYSAASARGHCHELAREADCTHGAALQQQGIGPHEIANALAALLKHKRPEIRLWAIKEATRMQDGYPAPKEPGDSSRPVQLIFPQNFKSLEVRTTDGSSDHKSSTQNPG